MCCRGARVAPCGIRCACVLQMMRVCAASAATRQKHLVAAILCGETAQCEKFVVSLQSSGRVLTARAAHETEIKDRKKYEKRETIVKQS